MDYASIDDNFKSIVGYNYSLTHIQAEKLAIIIKNLQKYLMSDNKIDSNYQVVTNLAYRLLSGDYATVRVMYGQYEKLMAAENKDLKLIGLYQKILSLITVKKYECVSLSSVNARNGNFKNDKEENYKPVLVVSNPTLKRHINN